MSRLQKETDYGCKAYEKAIISHFYMDDLKMCKSDQQLLEILHSVKQFSNDIRMESVLDKCVKSTFVKGKRFKTDNVALDKNTIIEELELECSYKYLSICELSNPCWERKWRMLAENKSHFENDDDDNTTTTWW